MPVHVVTTEASGSQGLAVYALIYDGQFVDNPVTFQLKASAELLFSGRKAMTLLMANDLAGSASDVNNAPSAKVLLAALQAFAPR